jgi:drug/metabolite transporter (DMT)-like permease
MSSANVTKGIYFALIAAVISGFSVFINKIAVSTIKPPIVFTAEKNALVGLLIIGVIFATFKWKKIKHLTRKETIYLLLIAVIGGAIPFYLFFTGLSQISAINGQLINKTLVFWTAVLAILFLKERMNKTQIIAVLLLFISNFFIGGFMGFKYSTGELLVLLATMLWAVESILAKKILPNVDPDIVTAARMGIGSAILLVMAAIIAPTALKGSIQHMTQVQMFWMVISVSLLFGYVTCWYRALKYAPVIMVASILVAATLITNILSAIFITHAWTLMMGIQSVMIALGVGLFWYAEKTKTKISSTPKLSSVE